MASLEKLVVKLRQRKNEASKLRLRAEKQLKEVKSLERRSSSGLVSLDRKIESEREDSTDVSGILTQKTSQLESIQRLIAAAEERLSREKEALSDTEQQLEFAENEEEKQFAQSRLNSIKGHIEELEYEIKSRQKTAKKISEDVAKNTEIKSKITSKIKKQAQNKLQIKLKTEQNKFKISSKEFQKRSKRSSSFRQTFVKG